jgi:hypothetical protein
MRGPERRPHAGFGGEPWPPEPLVGGSIPSGPATNAASISRVLDMYGEYPYDWRTEFVRTLKD